MDGIVLPDRLQPLRTFAQQAFSSGDYRMFVVHPNNHLILREANPGIEGLLACLTNRPSAVWQELPLSIITDTLGGKCQWIQIDAGGEPFLLKTVGSYDDRFMIIPDASPDISAARRNTKRYMARYRSMARLVSHGVPKSSARSLAEVSTKLELALEAYRLANDMVGRHKGDRSDALQTMRQVQSFFLEKPQEIRELLGAPYDTQDFSDKEMRKIIASTIYVLGIRPLLVPQAEAPEDRVEQLLQDLRRIPIQKPKHMR